MDAETEKQRRGGHGEWLSSSRSQCVPFNSGVIFEQFFHPGLGIFIGAMSTLDELAFADINADQDLITRDSATLWCANPCLFNQSFHLIAPFVVPCACPNHVSIIAYRLMSASSGFVGLFLLHFKQMRGSLD